MKTNIRKAIFFLLLYVDPETKNEYSNIDVCEAFKGLQYRLNGLNSILCESPELLNIMCLLEAALMEYNSECFEFSRYRKLILDAGSEIMKLKEGDENDTDL